MRSVELILLVEKLKKMKMGLKPPIGSFEWKDVLIGEVSMCNDDNTDNRFYEKVGRLSEIEEDEPIYRYLCNEYPVAKK